MEIVTGLFAWVMKDPVRSLILSILIVCTWIITGFKKTVKDDVKVLTDSNDAHKVHMDAHETAMNKEFKDCKTLVNDLNGTVMAMNMTLNQTVKEISAHKSDIIKALIENKMEVRQSIDVFKAAASKLTEVKKEVDANMGRILEVDAKLKTLVERNKK